MAERTLVENVAQVKADFKAIKDAVGIVIPEGTPTSEYGERIFNTISSLENEIENSRTEGIEQGKQEVISNSKYIEKTASGKVIRLDDVSEVYHNVKVKADTPTEVKVYGKNLFNDDISLIKSLAFMVASQEQIKNGYELSLPKGTYTFGLTQLDTAGHYVYGVINDGDGNFVRSCNLLTGTTNSTPVTITVNEGDKVYIYDGVSVNFEASRGMLALMQIQLEAGFKATPYEEYKEPQTITATPSGTEASSICPTMTFLADNDVTIDYFGSYGMVEKEVAMWKALTFNGARKQYQYAFANTDYTGFVIPDGMCKPSSTIAYMLYYYQGIEAPKGIDCSGFNGTNQASQGNFTFYNSPNLIKIYDMGIPAGILLNNTYSNCRKLEEIEIIRCNENTTFTSAFISCTGLIKVIFSGTNTSDIDIHWSTKLSRESILSLLQCLNATVSGIVITLPSMCIDGATDTLALIQGDTELNTAYTNALSMGYTISFV